MEMVDGMINIHTTTLSERPILVDSLVQFHMLYSEWKHAIEGLEVTLINWMPPRPILTICHSNPLLTSIIRVLDMTEHIYKKIYKKKKKKKKPINKQSQNH